MNPDSSTAILKRAGLPATLWRPVMRSVVVAGIAVAFSALLAACGAQPAVTSSPASATPIAADQSASASEATTTTDTNWLQTASLDGDHYLLGNPAAPVRITDYSDFL